MEKVLVVENDELLRKAYTLRLKKDGFEVEVVRNGAEGLRKFKSFKPDVVLIEILIAKKNGFKFMKEARDHLKKNKHEVKIVIMSNLEQEPDIKEAFKLGADDYLVKTEVDIRKISTRLRKLKPDKPKKTTVKKKKK